MHPPETCGWAAVGGAREGEEWTAGGVPRLGNNTDGDATPVARIARLVACDVGVSEPHSGPCAVEMHAGNCPYRGRLKQM